MTSYSETALVRSLTMLADSQQVVAHNIANVSTAGFKRSSAVSEGGQPHFHRMLDDQLPMPAFRQALDFTPGDLESTGNKLDLALEGDGFFRVRDGQGREFLTRQGRATLDSQGRLVTTNGLKILDSAQREIQLRGPEGIPSDIKINAAGIISDGQENGVQWGPIGVYQASNRNALTPVGNGLFAEASGVEPELDLTTQVRQGMTERSNVSSVDELVRMISVQRAFQGTQKALGSVSRMRAEFVQSLNR